MTHHQQGAELAGSIAGPLNTPWVQATIKRPIPSRRSSSAMSSSASYDRYELLTILWIRETRAYSRMPMTATPRP